MTYASCSGDTCKSPWPMETEMVSPLYHFSRDMRIFRAGDGTTPARFARQIDAGAPAESREFRIVGDVIDADPVAHVIEVDVARVDDSAQHVHCPVASRQVAAIILPVEARPARAVGRPVRIDDSGFQAGQRHDRLKGRPGGELRLNRAIQEGLVRIGS